MWFVLKTHLLNQFILLSHFFVRMARREEELKLNLLLLLPYNSVELINKPIPLSNYPFNNVSMWAQYLGKLTASTTIGMLWCP